jgi:hypothetical protein
MRIVLARTGATHGEDSCTDSLWLACGAPLRPPCDKFMEALSLHLTSQAGRKNEDTERLGESS